MSSIPFIESPSCPSAPTRPACFLLLPRCQCYFPSSSFLLSFPFSLSNRSIIFQLLFVLVGRTGQDRTGKDWTGQDDIRDNTGIYISIHLIEYFVDPCNVYGTWVPDQHACPVSCQRYVPDLYLDRVSSMHHRSHIFAFSFRCLSFRVP